MLESPTADLTVLECLLQRMGEQSTRQLGPSILFEAVRSTRHDHCNAAEFELLLHHTMLFDDIFRDQLLQHTTQSGTLLHEFVKHDAVGALQSALQHKTMDVNQLSHDGLSPLHLALREGSTRAIEVLIDAGADLRLPSMGSIKQQPLAWAISARRLNLVPLASRPQSLAPISKPSANLRTRQLLAKGADPWLGNQATGGPSFLHLAANERRLTVAPMRPIKNVVLPFPAPYISMPTDSPLSELLSKILPLGLYQRIVHGENNILNAVNRNGETCLHMAVYSADIQGLEELLRAKANPLIKDNTGRTPREWVDIVYRNLVDWPGGVAPNILRTLEEIRKKLQAL